jgi:hypothetical protein
MANFLSCVWSFTGGACFILLFDGSGIMFGVLGFLLLAFAGFCGLIAWEEIHQIGRGDDYCASCDK